MSFVPLPLISGQSRAVDGAEVRPFSGAVDLVGGTSWILAVDRCVVRWRGEAWPIPASGFAVVPGAAEVVGRGLVITLPAYTGLFHLGAGVEARGRLAYIDGCTDTLLQSPPRVGEPCLNHLHIPAGTTQTEHTHPSARVGTIVRGSGICRAGGREYALSPGMGWVIPTGLPHCFHTAADALDVIAWHPDSDFGPTDEDHPMKNRTILG
jgi:quercetin dioxygenase-like cupin family protein